MPGPRTQPRRKIVAIMAADVAGYSRLMGRDEEGTYAALRGHLDELFIPKIEEFEGRIIKFIGDGVLAEFPSAVDALNCAANLQAQMAERNRPVPADRQLNFRIGLHVGDVMEVDGDLFGDGVNTAARVEGTATPGGINVSRFVYDSARKKVTFEFEDLGDHMFKSFEEPVQVFRVLGFQRPRTELRLGEQRERIAPGTRLNGIYEIDSLLVVGSTSEIYRARSVQTGDPVVIKAIAPQLTQTPAAIDNVRSQASALYHLSHDAIARTFLCSLDEAVGQVYLAMEAVDGLSLFDRVRHEPLTPEEAHVLRRRIAGALAEAHHAGIIHRAVTPDNIVLPEGDVARCKLIDFTITGLRPESERTVISAGLDAKSQFQAPEQIGHYGGREGPATDAYGLGQVLAFAVTGEPLQKFGTFAELVEGRKNAPDPATLPPALKPLLEVLLAPDPARRVSDMAAIAAWDGTSRLRPAAASAVADPSADAMPAPAAQKPRSKRGLVAAAAALVVALSGAGAWFVLTDGPAPAEGPAPTSSSTPVAAPAASAPEVATTPPEPSQPPTETAAAPQEAAPAAAADPPETADQGADADAADEDAEAGPDEPSFASLSEGGGRDPVRLTTLDGRSGVPPQVASMMRAVDAVNTAPCFFASVDSAGADELSVDMYGTSSDVIYEAYNAIKGEVGLDPSVTGRLISSGQCPALEFAQLGKSTSALDLSLVQRNVAAGEPLDGTLGNVPARRVLLVAIDPRGAVYDLTGALEPSPGGLRFLLNVNHPREGRVTSLLLAVSVPEGVEAPALPSGTLAKDYLPALAQAMADAGAPVAIRLDHFVLQSG